MANFSNITRQDSCYGQEHTAKSVDIVYKCEIVWNCHFRRSEMIEYFNSTWLNLIYKTKRCECEGLKFNPFWQPLLSENNWHVEKVKAKWIHLKNDDQHFIVNEVRKIKKGLIEILYRDIYKCENMLIKITNSSN